MKLLVGLGNPGKKYERTRHNAGFWLVERFAAQSGTALRKDAKFQALVGRHEPTGVWLLLPQSYMNSSGRPVQLLAGFFKILPAEMLVVHDDLDFAPGVAKIKQGGGIAGHNGLRDISARLGSHDYWRLRIGIGHPGDRQAVADYVLDKPSMEDRAEIDAAMEHALEALPLMLAGDVQGAMLKLHTQEKTQEKTETIAPAAKPDRPPRAGKPAQTEKPQQAEKLEQPGQTAQPEAPVIADKKSGLKSLFKKLMPGTKK